MSYKSTVTKKGKVYGPYNYESYRDENGNVKKRYLGKVEKKRKEKFLERYKKALGKFEDFRLPEFPKYVWISLIVVLAIVCAGFFVNFTGFSIANVTSENSSNVSVVENVLIEPSVSKVVESVIGAANSSDISTLQYKAVINRPVKWIKKVNTNKTNVSVEIPKGSSNISILTHDEVDNAIAQVDEFEQVVEKVDRKKVASGGALTGNVALDVDRSEGLLTRFWRWLTGFGITGNVILEEDITESIVETDNSTIVELGEVVSENTSAAVEYYTEAPKANETEISNGKRVIVSAPSSLNYTDILAYSVVDDLGIKMSDVENLKLYWYESEEDFVVEEGAQNETLVEENKTVIEQNETDGIQENKTVGDVNGSVVGEIENETVVEENETVSQEQNETVEVNGTISEAQNETVGDVNESESDSSQESESSESVSGEENVSEESSFEEETVGEVAEEAVVEESSTEEEVAEPEEVAESVEVVDEESEESGDEVEVSPITGAAISQINEIDKEKQSIDAEVSKYMNSETKVVGRKRHSVDFVPYDFDNDGYVDYIEWVVPHLSVQVYEVIYITKAEHLDSDRSVLSNIYSEVSAKDGVFSEEILEGEFVRVRFEKELDSSKDITIVAKSSGSSDLVVYTEGGTSEIARFSDIGAVETRKVYLSDLSGSSDSFDLEVVGDPVKFDYITDPSPIGLAVPQEFSIHGRLSNDTGVINGTFQFNFSLYDSYTGGSRLWNSVRDVTTDSEGVYDIILDVDGLNFSTQYFLGIAVENDSEMSPRLNLTTSPYSFMSEYVYVGGIIWDEDLNGSGYTITADVLAANDELQIGSGRMRWNSTDSVFEYYNGSSWLEIGSGSSSSGSSGIVNTISNDNGTCVQYSNGVQECWGEDISCTVGTNQETTVTFPSAFVNDWSGGLVFDYSIGSNAGYMPSSYVANTYPSTTQSRVVITVSGSVCRLYWHAVGRWTDLTNISVNDTTWAIDGNGNIVTFNDNQSVNITGDLILGEGKIRFNETSASYEYYNGTDWQEIGSGSSGSSFDQSLNTYDNVTFVNITADYFIGDGSLLTGISSGSSLWTNNSGDIYYNSGNVGIGTGSPEIALHVSKDGINLGGTGYYNFLSRNAANTKGVFFGYDTSEVTGIVGAANNGGNLAFWTNDNVTGWYERMRIDKDGNVGIGTSNPNSKLEVAGYINSTSGGFVFPDGSVQSTASGSGLWSSNGSSVYYNSGNIGVGTASPREVFEINGTLQLGEGKIRFNETSASYEFYNGTDWQEIGSGSSGSGQAGIWDNVSGVATYDGDVNITGDLIWNGVNLSGISGGSIVESGGNSTSGYYVKYSDGTMIVWGNITKTLSSENSVTGRFDTSGTTYYKTARVDFPELFIEKPIVNIQQNGYYVATSDASKNESGFLYYIFYGVSGLLSSTVVDYSAIGRWTDLNLGNGVGGSSGIVNTIENENGTCTQYSNGVMDCYYTELNVLIAAASSSDYGWKYPATWATTPSLVATAQPLTSWSGFSVLGAVTSGSVTDGYVHISNTGSQQYANLYFHAVGRWTNSTNVNTPDISTWGLDDNGNVVLVNSSREVNITGNLSLGNGKIRFNDTSASYEYYNGSVWSEIGSGTQGNVPAGAVVAFSSASCPDGWVAADGSGGTPDLRGIFIRGAGTSGVLNYSNSSYGGFSATYGEYMNDSFQGHSVSISTYGGGTTGAGDIGTTGSGADSTKDGTLVADGVNGELRAGTETAPASYALLYCVKTSDDSSNTTGAIGTLNDNVTFVQNVSHNFGVGTTNPREKLEVNGSSIFSSGNSGDNTLLTLDAEGTSTENNVLFQEDGSDQWSIGTIDSTKNFRLVDRLNDITVVSIEQGSPVNSLYVDSSGNVGLGTSSPSSRLDVNGSISTSVGTFSDNVTLDSGDSVVLVNSSLNEVWVTLPSASAATGRQYVIKKIDSSNNSVVIDGNGSEMVDLSLNVSINSEFESYSVVSDGGNWWII